MSTGLIFDIKRFSIQDGPGIRTTIFFKGCPLRCFWCHNPESQFAEREIMYYDNRCIHCLRCIHLCPKQAIKNVGEQLFSDINICEVCGTCETFCAADARKIIGSVVSVEEVIIEVEKDIPFFDQSHGGVTISGGEPLSQPEFLLALLKALKDRDIHTVVDTSGCQRWSVIDKIRTYVDLFLYDIKIINNEKHKLYTGVDNHLIIENLIKLAEVNQPLIVRIPIIPSINDSDENIRDTVALLARVPAIHRVDLLSYHSLGFGKYKGLGKPMPNLYGFDIQQNNNPERIETFKVELEKTGKVVHIY